MATKSDREAMAAALGGMVSRPASEPTAEPAAGATPEAPETVKVPPAMPKTAIRRAPKGKGAPEPEEEGGAFRKTGIGYVKADGTEMVRTVVMVTEAERQRLKVMALESGMSPSDYVRRALGFV